MLTPEKQQWIEWARAKAGGFDPLVRRSDPFLDAPEPEVPNDWPFRLQPGRLSTGEPPAHRGEFA